MDELVRQVADALAGPAYPGAPNGRVRQVPDRRAVRWYTTTGLVDRPVISGRTAYYGPRHLLQLVAVKRRQAEGRALADIQAELAGATDATLRRVAALDQPVAVPTAAGRAPGRGRFWTAPDVDSVSPPVAQSATQPAPPAPAAAEPIGAVRLPGGAVLVLPGAPHALDPDDLASIHAAARPLLTLLAERGLLNPDERSTS